jgi:hypothetical protein
MAILGKIVCTLKFKSTVEDENGTRDDAVMIPPAKTFELVEGAR